MKNINQELLKRYVCEVNHPKGELMKIMDCIQELDRSKAEKLGRIIAKLEAWQINDAK
jgi:hypothetical protein